MPRTTRLEVSDSARVSNIKKLSEVDVCDFYLAATDAGSFLLQKTAVQPEDGLTVNGYDVTTAAVIPLPADTEVDVVEEVKVVTIND